MSFPSESTPALAAGSRRNFLKAGLALAGGALATAAPLAAAEVPQRNGKPYMKLSLAAYSMRKFLTGKSPSMTLDDFIKMCGDLDLDGCELTSYYFPKGFDDDYLRSVKQLTFRLGLDISGTAIGNNFCLQEGAAREATLKLTRDWIDHASVMGAPVIRIFAGTIPKGDNEQAALERCVAGVNESLEYAAQKGVFLALENHGGITSTPEQLLAIVEKVKPSPWFGVNLDCGNFRTNDPYADLAKIAPYAINAQIKTDITQAGKRGDTDIPRVIEILSNANYRGYVVLEYEGKDDPKVAVPKYIGELRKIIRG